MTYIDSLKYDNFIDYMDSHFSKAKVINYNIIHHQWWGDKLENPEQYNQKIYVKDFVSYGNHVQYQQRLRLSLMRSISNVIF